MTIVFLSTLEKGEGCRQFVRDGTVFFVDFEKRL